VLMLSGLRTRCSLGRSVFANVWCASRQQAFNTSMRARVWDRIRADRVGRNMRATHDLIVLLAELLAHELAHPVVAA
jgi:hypothetical protein